MEILTAAGQLAPPPALDHADLTWHLGAWLLFEGPALRTLNTDR